MNINGLDGLTLEEIGEELEQGATFVVYEYCISILILTFTRGTGVYFVRSDESAALKGLPWTFVSLCFGWWGFPFGLIFTPIAIIKNLAGGKDVTREVVFHLHAQVRQQREEEEAFEPVFE